MLDDNGVYEGGCIVIAKDSSGMRALNCGNSGCDEDAIAT